MRNLLLLIVCSAFIVGCEQKQSDNSQGRVSSQQQNIAQTKDWLRHNPDPQALLAAFREVMRTRKSFPGDPRWQVHGGDAAAVDESVSFIKPNAATLPPVVREMRADAIRCYDDHLDIVFGGEKGPMGLVAGAEGFTNIAGTVQNAKTEKVIEGLWFYEIQRPK